MGRSQGVTLIELVTAITILAILTSLTIPSFGNLRRDAERSTAVNALLHAVFLARSETIRRSQTVSICKSRDGSTCTRGGNWHEGWIVFANPNHATVPQRDANEPLLLVNQGWPHGTITSNRESYSFRPYQQGVVNGTLVFCDSRGSAQARAIIISHTGRPRVAVRGSDNKPLKCPAR
jgi:type IV fimbrial biogenesis protein FimT